jgi:filamentous hemagglutinin family protein
MWRAKFPPILLYSIFLVGFYDSAVLAQTVPDHTLGSESSTVDQDVTIGDTLVDLIEGGAIRGNNLFHSFSEFNVGDGSAVYFASPDGIANILTRVTGNNPSEIFGTLGVDGAANLFLLNPNGIVFGENAALDVNGSFLATTADSYIFDNGFAYSASNPNLPPLLTVNIPVGLQFGNQAEAIINQSRVPNEFGFTAGLQVDPEHNLTLLGGNILFEQGYLAAPNGEIELGSVVPHSLVKIIPTENNWTLDYTEIDDFQDINFTQSAEINTSSNRAGRAGKINLQANNLNILEGSSITVNNFGAKNGGRLNINAQESVKVDGVDGIGINDIPSHIQTNNYNSGLGAELNINAKTLQVNDGAYISANNYYGTGNGGNLTISASESVSLIASEESNFSFISTNVLNRGTGKGGNLTLTTGELLVRDGGQISSGTYTAGDSGDLSIKAERIEVSGLNINNGFASGLFTGAYDGTGNGGNLTLTTGELLVKDGSQISSGTYTAGDSGDLSVTAERIEVSGGNNDFPGGLFAGAYEGAGKGGNLTLTTGELLVRDGGQISSETYGAGDSGDLSIQAERVEVSGLNINNGFASGLLTNVEPDATGNGGNLKIDTGILTIKEGGGIFSHTSGMGDAGNIFIRANNLEVRDTVVDPSGSRSGINSRVEQPGVGNGGNVDIIANNLGLINGGSISVDTLGKGNAGNIAVQAHNINIAGVSSTELVFGIEQKSLPSQISALSHGDFDAGSIAINTDTLNISDRGNISVSNLGNGNSGNLNITAKELNLDHSATLEAKVNAGSQGNINLTTDNIFLRNNSEINVLATGRATGGNIKISNRENIVVTKNSRILANAIRGKGGNIEITTQGYFVSGDSLVSASSEFGLDGNIKVENINGDRPLELDQLPANLVDRTQQIAKSCGVGTNQFAIAGRGGLPENPWQNLRGQTVWQDLRLIAIDSNKTSQIQADLPSTPILEAQAWKINDLGQIELIAINGDAPRLDNQGSCQ